MEDFTMKNSMTILLAGSFLVLTVFSAVPSLAAPLPASAVPALAEIAKPSLPQSLQASAKPQQQCSGPCHYDRATIAKMARGQRQVLLTFDDGPNPRTTPQVLDVLRQHHAKAVFFILGSNAKKHPELVKRIANEGHVLGNHSFHHPYLTKLPPERIRQEIVATNLIIEEITGVRPTLFRPPYGAINRSVMAVLQQEGMSMMLWNLDPADWRYRNSDRAVSILSRQMKLDTGGKGGIVILHDTVPATIPTLADLLTVLRQHRFAVVAFDSFGQDKQRMWPTRDFVVLRHAFPRKLHAKVLAPTHPLAAVFMPKPVKPLNTVRLLQAKKLGTLRHTLLCLNL